ncbi:MAG: pitrilysin family protein [Coriobacteriia bacterium]|nr:pitrilysin family protein [Coriobacteriia bacterium]
MFYERSVTPGGVTVITERMAGFRSAAIGIWVAAGSRDELPGEAGVSHFVEHMMFKGTPSRSAAEISEAFDRIGARFNAGTDKEYTTYYCQVIDQHAVEAFSILADMVSHSLMEEPAVLSEREVVLEEISRSEDQPDDMVHDLFASTLFPSHPIGRPVLGTPSTVGAFMPADVFAYTARRYGSGNVVVAAAGNIDHAALVAQVNRELVVPKSERTDRGEMIPTVTPRFEIVTKDTEQAHICWGSAGLRSRDPERFAMGVMDTIIGGGMSSRLFQEIREKRGLAYAVGSYHAQYLDTGHFTVYAGTRPDNAEKVVALIKSEVERFIEGGATPDELFRAKESMKGNLVLGMESTSARMSRLGKSEVTSGELLTLDELVERIDAVEQADLTRVAASTIAGPRVLAMVAPFEKEAVAHLLD